MKRLIVKLFKQIIVNKDGSTVTEPTTTGAFTTFRDYDTTKAAAFLSKRLQEIANQRNKKRRKFLANLQKENKS